MWVRAKVDDRSERLFPDQARAHVFQRHFEKGFAVAAIEQIGPGSIHLESKYNRYIAGKLAM